MSSNPRKLLQEAWQERQQQNHSACRPLLAQLKAILGIELGNLTRDQIVLLLNRQEELLTDTLVLAASMARADRQFNYSSLLLTTLKEASLAGRIPNTFRLLQELGHQCLLKGDFSSALEYYYGSKALAFDELSHYTAAVNILVSIEYLELPCEEEEKEVTQTIAALKKSKSVFNQEILGVYELYLARKDFQKGEVASFFERLESYGGAQLTHYQRSFVASLGFHQFYKGEAVSSAETLGKGNSLFLGSYRMRTLAGLTHPTDENIPRLGEVVERSYLWLWKWLMEPTAFPLSKLVLQLRQLSYQETPAFCEQDTSLLSVIFAWLELLSPGNTTWFRQIKSQLALRSPNAGTVLEFEFLTAKYLLLLRDRQQTEAEDLLQYLKESPLWSSKELYFARVIELCQSKSPKNLPKYLKTFCIEIAQLIRTPKPVAKGLLVDLRLSHIYEGKLENPIPSRPIALALVALKKETNLTFSQFLDESFQINGYDSFYHDPKIYNLLARIKKILPPGLTIKTKEGRINTFGNWDLIEVHSGCVYTRILSEENLWLQLTGSGPTNQGGSSSSGSGAPESDHFGAFENQNEGIEKRTYKCQLKSGEVFTRSSLQEEFSLKRSTANRMIARWEQERKITKIGQGRNTKYQTQKTLTENQL